MIRITEKPCDFCGSESVEWYQTVCHWCGDAFCRSCAAPGPCYCIRCEDPETSDQPASP